MVRSSLAMSLLNVKHYLISVSQRKYSKFYLYFLVIHRTYVHVINQGMTGAVQSAHVTSLHFVKLIMLT